MVTQQSPPKRIDSALDAIRNLLDRYQYRFTPEGKKEADEKAKDKAKAKAKARSDKRIAKSAKQVERAERQHQSNLKRSHGADEVLLRILSATDQSSIALQKAQKEHYNILKNENPAKAAAHKYRTRFQRGPEVCIGGLSFTMITQHHTIITVHRIIGDDGIKRIDFERLEREIIASGVHAMSLYSMTSRVQGRSGDTPHDAGITQDIYIRPDSHWKGKVQQSLDRAEEDRKSPTLEIRFYTGFRNRDQLDQMESWMAQSARQLGPEENPNCISGKKFARGYKVPLRVDWALPGVHSMGAGAEAIRRQNGPSFPPNTDEQRRAAEWFNDTFRPIFG